MILSQNDLLRDLKLETFTAIVASVFPHIFSFFSSFFGQILTSRLCLFLLKFNPEFSHPGTMISPVHQINPGLSWGNFRKDY